MFSGKFRHVLDSKNRVIIPSRLREGAGKETEGLVFHVGPGNDKCLYLLPEETFKEYTEEMGYGFRIGRKKREWFRKLMTNVERRVCDRQGRIQIPEKLIEYAGLKDEVVFVGFVNLIELWDAQEFDKLGQDGLQGFGELAEEVIEDE